MIILSFKKLYYFFNLEKENVKVLFMSYIRLKV